MRLQKLTLFPLTRFVIQLACVAVLLPLLLAASAAAQVKFSGPGSVQNFGQQAIGSVSSPRVLSFTVAAGTKVGSVAVLTTGISGLDFAAALGTTCTAATYASATTCSVKVNFAPLAAGNRLGAVVFFSQAKNTGAILCSVPLFGLGTGPQIAYGSGTVTAVDRTIHNTVGLTNPGAMTTDAAGNLYVLDSDGNRPSYTLVKITPAGVATTMQPVVNGMGLDLPSCVAVDGAGNLYIGDFGRRVIEVPVGGASPTAIDPVVNGIPLNYPSGLAVDGAGDLFISDFINNRVLEVPAGGGAPIALTPAVGGVALNDPHGLALDGAGNLFIADLGNDRVIKLPLGGGAATAIDPLVGGQSLRNPVGVALDASGDLFIADIVNHRVVEVPAAGGEPTAIDPSLYFSGMGDVYSVAVDAAGDLFFAQGGLSGGANIVEEEQYGQNQAINFATPTDLATTDTVDGQQSVAIQNIGNQPLVITGLSYPADFSAGVIDSTTCTSSTTLAPGQQCNVSIEFTPQNTGALSESIQLTDNVLNVPGSHQLIQVTGTAEKQAAILSPAPGTMLSGANVPFTWSAGIGATAYYLSIGSTGVGSSNIFNTGKRTVTTWTATALPTNGSTLYVRLTTYFGAIQMHSDYVYTALGNSTMTAPAPGSVLPGSTATFSWSGGAGATSYTLWLGSTGAGSKNLVNTGIITATSINISGLPVNGEKIYARLITNFNGVQAYNDYVYTAK